MQEASIHQSHVYGQIKISWPLFEKGHPRNIPVKLFQNLTDCYKGEDFFKELLNKFHFIAMANRSFDGVKFCEQFKEDLPRNIPAKFGPNWPSRLGGEGILRSC